MGCICSHFEFADNTHHSRLQSYHAIIPQILLGLSSETQCQLVAVWPLCPEWDFPPNFPRSILIIFTSPRFHMALTCRLTPNAKQ